MEHLPKETLLMIIKDLTGKLEEKNKSITEPVDESPLCSSAADATKDLMKILKEVDPNMSDRMRSHYKKQVVEKEGLIFKLLLQIREKLLKSEDELKAGLAVAERDKASLIIENEELGKEIDRLKSEQAQSETSSLTQDEISSESSNDDVGCGELDEFSMNSKERINTFHFIEKFCKWTEEPQRVLDKDDNIYRTVAIGSVQEIHKGLREWAKQSGIATKGKDRGIPVYDSFKKFIVNEHKKKYSNIPWRISETNKFPKFYNGSYSTPRVNLKVSGRVTRFL